MPVIRKRMIIAVNARYGKLTLHVAYKLYNEGDWEAMMGRHYQLGAMLRGCSFL